MVQKQIAAMETKRLKKIKGKDSSNDSWIWFTKNMWLNISWKASAKKTKEKYM